MLFSWSRPGSLQALAVLFFACSSFGIVLAVFRFQTVVRGLLALLLAVGGMAMCTAIGLLPVSTLLFTLAWSSVCAGILLRSEYSSPKVPHVLTTVTSLVSIACVIYFGGSEPLTIYNIVSIVLMSLSMCVWIPSNKSSIYRFMVTINLLWFGALGILTSFHGGSFTKNLASHLFIPVVLTCWSVLLIFGVATILGKGLEPRRNQ